MGVTLPHQAGSDVLFLDRCAGHLVYFPVLPEATAVHDG